jgi:hypothetical protein
MCSVDPQLEQDLFNKSEEIAFTLAALEVLEMEVWAVSHVSQNSRSSFPVKS